MTRAPGKNSRGTNKSENKTTDEKVVSPTHAQTHVQTHSQPHAHVQPASDFPENINKTHVRYRLLSFKQPTSEIGCGFVRTRSMPTRRFGPGTQGYFGILLILRGTGTLLTGKQEKIKVGPGHAIQFFAGSNHVLFHESDDWLEATISMDHALIEQFLLLNDMDICQPVLSPGLSNNLVNNIKQLHDALEVDSRNHLPALLLQAQQLILQVHLASRSHSVAQSNEYRLLEKACLMLEDKACFHLDLEQIAADLKMDYRQMRYLFRKHLSLSPGQYRLKHKMAIASNMLAQKHKGIARIAKELGYSDAFTFSRQFKLFHGKPPTHYAG